MNHDLSVVPGSLRAILEKGPNDRRADRLLVIVDVELAQGCTAEIAAAVPQGINPLIKLLRVRIGSPSRVDRTASAKVTLRYEEVPAAADYQEVWLGEGDAAISTKVSVAS